MRNVLFHPVRMLLFTKCSDKHGRDTLVAKVQVKVGGGEAGESRDMEYEGRVAAGESGVDCYGSRPCWQWLVHASVTLQTTHTQGCGTTRC